MTNNRKPVDEVRLSWDAKAAFKSLNAQGKRRQASIDDERLKTTPYTPPPNVAAWLQAQADKPKAGRDIGSLMRYHAAHKKGRTDDDCLREKFGASSARSPEASEVGGLTKTPTHAPTPPQSADGGKPLLSAVTKPHGKDVDTADGPWPKYVIGEDGACIIESAHSAVAYYSSGTVTRVSSQYIIERWVGVTREQPSVYRFANHVDFAQWLEQNGHADAAAQLRGTPRDDVATGGGRVWEDGGFAWVQIGGVLYSRVPVGHFVKCVSGRMSYMMPEWELFGTERDAILSECRKAMPCPQKPAS